MNSSSRETAARNICVNRVRETGGSQQSRPSANIFGMFFRTCKSCVVVCRDLVLDKVVARVGVGVVDAGSADECAVECLWVRGLAIEGVPAARRSDGAGAGGGAVMRLCGRIFAVANHKRAAGVAQDIAQLLLGGAVDGSLQQQHATGRTQRRRAMFSAALWCDVVQPLHAQHDSTMPERLLP